MAEALGPEKVPGEGEAPDDAEPPEVKLDAALSFSARELLRHKDFEQMCTAEIEQARALIRKHAAADEPVPTRRFRRDPRGWRVDLGRTLRQSLRGGGAMIDLARKRRVRRHPPLVILSDISGSMERYARMLLHFMHGATSDRDRVFSFVFGTRLTNVTRQLRARDVDFALKKVGDLVEDWSGGARIGHCLHAFNRVWSRRVLGQGAVVLLITDGLDRDAGEGLEVEMERLHKSCRRLIWLNPLLRFDGYAPLASGARGSSATSTTSARSTTSTASPTSPPPSPTSPPAARKASRRGRAWPRSVLRRRRRPNRRWTIARRPVRLSYGSPEPTPLAPRFGVVAQAPSISTDASRHPPFDATFWTVDPTTASDGMVPFCLAVSFLAALAGVPPRPSIALSILR